MNSFCVGLYNGEITIFGGWSDVPDHRGVIGTYPVANSYSTSTFTTPSPWIQNNFFYYPFNGNFTFSQPCVQMPGQSLLYAVPPAIRINESLQYQGEHLIIFDLATQSYLNTNTYASQLPIKAHRACVTMVANKIYVIGGQLGDTNKTIHDNVQMYNTVSNEWSQRASLNIARERCACEIVPDLSDNIFVFGGSMRDEIDKRFASDSIEKYSIANDEWFEIDTKLSTGRQQHRCTYFEGFIFCVGGYAWTGPLPVDIDVFNPYNERILGWDISLNAVRYGIGQIVFDDELLVLGGTNETNRLGSIEVIDLSVFVPTINPTVCIVSCM